MSSINKKLNKEFKDDDEPIEETNDDIAVHESENSESEDSYDSNEAKLKMLKNLKYDYASYEIKYIYETYLKNSDEINLNPSYQREFAWSNDKQDLFIDSVINNYIIPPIILIKLNHKKGFRYECMDGQHRLTVLKHFIEGTPINNKSPHHIKFTKKEDGKIIDIYYKKPENDDKSCSDNSQEKKNTNSYDTNTKSLKNYRIMNEDELNAFNDKKLIVIKITNFDKKMDDVFNKIKNEMFLRLQKGERVTNTDVLRNHDNTFINVLREQNILKFNTYLSSESYKRLYDIIDIKPKKINMQLNVLIYFVIRCILIIHKKSLNVGSLNDNVLRDEILKNKDVRFEMSTDDINSCIDKMKKFVTRIYKMKEQNEFSKLNEYFLLVLLKIYLDEKDDLNTCLEHIHDFSEYNSDEYYNKLIVKNVNNKKVKFIVGKYFEKPLEEIKEKIKTYDT
jgi:hypothetical protein